MLHNSRIALFTSVTNMTNEIRRVTIIPITYENEVGIAFRLKICQLQSFVTPVSKTVSFTINK